MDRLHGGDQLAGRYLLIKPLRSGGSAVVWLALDQQDGIEVALKIREADSLSELTKEFETLKLLSHPAIVTAHDLATADGFAFLVLDLIDGAELSQYMGADFRIWLPMLRPVAAALDYAHRLGVVHGDLKLENMLVTEDNIVCLVDFSRQPDSVAADDLRALGIVMTELATGFRSAEIETARVPVALTQLIRELTDKAGSIESSEVVGKIDEVLDKAMSRAESEQFERIAPVPRQTPVRELTAPVAKRSGLLWPWIAVFVVLVAAISITLFWQQLFSENGEVITASDTVTRDSVDEVRARLDSLAERTRHESSAVYEKWLSLEAMNVSTWAELRSGRAFELLKEGERLASELDYISALRVLKESDDLFSALLQQAPGIAVDRREAGWLAYNGGDAETAATHFRVALAIDPEQDDVRAALRRTAFLEQITTLTRRAKLSEENGDLQDALAALTEASRIDADNSEIELEIARLNTSLESARFQATLSKVYSALSRKDYKQARQFLAQAARARADAPEVRDAATQLDLAERAAATASLRARALEAENAENWETAIELYSQLLAIDPALVLAQQGRDRSRRLAALSGRAERLLATPLINNSVRGQVESLLEQIDNVSASAPTLQKLALQLEDALRLSRLPVKVHLESDNRTEIQVQRVARLGAFERHELELMPGQYTIVGTRAGYRDVRTELVVEAGKAPAPLLIRCEEQI